MEIRCNRAKGCSYKRCPHIDGHEEVDNCTREGECMVMDKDVKCERMVIDKDVKCVPIKEDKAISKHSRKGNRIEFVLKKFQKEFDNLAKGINIECKRDGVKLGVRLSGVGIYNGLFDDMLKW